MNGAEGQIDQLLADAAGCLLPLDRASSLPSTAFTDVSWFDRERHRLFHGGWIAVGRVTDLAEPNDYITANIAGEPCVVVRRRNGELSALSNVCPHRMTTIMRESSGSSPSLQCGYHLWTFGHDGQLKAAPGMHDTSDFDLTDVCLASFAVDEWHGWVMVNIDRNARPFRDSAPALDALFTEHRMGECVKVGELDYPSPWNWKITVENFLESYHHRGVHPVTLDATYPGSKSFGVYEGDEPWSGVDHVSVVDESDPFIALAAYPSLLVAINRGLGMFWFRTEPLTPTACHLTIESYVLPELVDIPGIADDLATTIEAINAEDIAINLCTAAGVQSKFAAPGRVSHLEASPWHFRRWLVQQLTD